MSSDQQKDNSQQVLATVDSPAASSGSIESTDTNIRYAAYASRFRVSPNFKEVFLEKKEALFTNPSFRL